MPALDAVCRRFADVNLILNKKKYEFYKSAMAFLGFVFSEKWDCTRPQENGGRQKCTSAYHSKLVSSSFLGMATYCAKFMPRFSDTSTPLRELTTKLTQFPLVQST